MVARREAESMVWNALKRALGLTDEPARQNRAAVGGAGRSDAAEPAAVQGLAGAAADQEAAAELDPWLTSAQQAQAYQWAPDDGVMVKPTPITLGQEVTIRYKGLLAKSGADRLFLHYGYGPGPWRHVTEIAMDRQPDGSWIAQIRADEPGRLNFCFRDAASNWDNNNGRDWSYEVHTGEWPH